MSLVTDSLFGTENKIEKSIEALKLFEPSEGYYVAFSGGKDSVVVKALCDMAGVKYDAHYRITSVDPPELIRFIKEHHPDVEMEYPRYRDGTIATMWNLIPKKRYPPTRLVRYCCDVLKESGGKGRLTVTGVRWAESVNRQANQGKVTIMSLDKGTEQEALDSGNFTKTDRGGVVLVNDNTESREVIEGCYQKNKVVLNPIIDWEDEDVWEFIKERNLPYCELYDRGYKRLGCIGCPMSTNAKDELERYPKYKAAYIRAFERMLNRNRDMYSWDTGEEVMDWWINPKKEKILDGQMEMEL